MANKSDKPRRNEAFEDQLTTLVEEIGLAVRWQRPSILIAIYRSESVHAAVEAELIRRLHDLGQKVRRLRVTEGRFDVPMILSRHRDRGDAVFLVTGFQRGGGRQGNHAYLALNMRREYFVERRLRVVLWLTESEAFDLPRQAPDFWVFRHRVVEFI